jgi:uncharacterized protein (TIGR03067 family)
MSDEANPERQRRGDTPTGEAATHPVADEGPRTAGEGSPQQGPVATPKTKRGRTWVVAAVVVGLAAVGFAVWYFLIRTPEPRNDLERFAGEWKLTDARQRSGESEEVRLGVRVKGDTWTYVAAGGEGKAFRITLNEAAAPKEIDLELIDTTGLRGPTPRMRGVYAFEGNTKVRVRLKDATQPRPKSLDDPDATDWILTKVKLEHAPPQR